ncbi:GGDEF domain-containing protein [Arcobacter sp. LA11]|uniref:GGDEF domain-containing protein n=1 Tax=Arcobacter sp. LA11 TaxID=1898176 RepID=UPI0009335CD4|nr:GGDEF domain-containing protein [Arcobacter sp. LA11]
MKDITEIIETTLKNLEKNNTISTPMNFEKEFYSILKKTDLILEEYVEHDDIIDSLSNDEKRFFEKNDLSTFRDLAKILSNRITESEIKKFLKDFSYFISPSINNEIKNEINEVSCQIANEPNHLINNETIRNLRKLTARRIKSDKALFNEKTADVKKLILFLGDHFKKTLKQNCITIEEIVDIKNDINSLELSNSSKDDLNNLQNKLINVMERFEKTIELNREDIISRQTQNDYLYEQIEELQCSLNKAEEEKSIDYLTGVLTRRAYNIELDRVEEHFRIFDSNYAIIFYDLDHFKKINDNYGHDCGDSILATFASILNKLTRTEDIISRYGGEEFISLVHYSNKLEIENYLKRVKNIITNNRFVYGDVKINVEFCAGVSFRENYSSYSEAVKKADSLLYQAKNEGRNKIVLDTNLVF